MRCSYLWIRCDVAVNVCTNVQGKDAKRLLGAVHANLISRCGCEYKISRNAAARRSLGLMIEVNIVIDKRLSQKLARDVC